MIVEKSVNSTSPFVAQQGDRILRAWKSMPADPNILKKAPTPTSSPTESFVHARSVSLNNDQTFFPSTCLEAAPKPFTSQILPDITEDHERLFFEPSNSVTSPDIDKPDYFQDAAFTDYCTFDDRREMSDIDLRKLQSRTPCPRSCTPYMQRSELCLQCENTQVECPDCLTQKPAISFFWSNASFKCLQCVTPEPDQFDTTDLPQPTINKDKVLQGDACAYDSQQTYLRQALRHACPFIDEPLAVKLAGKLAGSSTTEFSRFTNLSDKALAELSKTDTIENGSVLCMQLSTIETDIAYAFNYGNNYPNPGQTPIEQLADNIEQFCEKGHIPIKSTFCEGLCMLLIQAHLSDPENGFSHFARNLGLLSHPWHDRFRYGPGSNLGIEINKSFFQYKAFLLNEQKKNKLGCADIDTLKKDNPRAYHFMEARAFLDALLFFHRRVPVDRQGIDHIPNIKQVSAKDWYELCFSHMPPMNCHRSDDVASDSSSLIEPLIDPLIEPPITQILLHTFKSTPPDIHRILNLITACPGMYTIVSSGITAKMRYTGSYLSLEAQNTNTASKTERKKTFQVRHVTAIWSNAKKITLFDSCTPNYFTQCATEDRCHLIEQIMWSTFGDKLISPDCLLHAWEKNDKGQMHKRQQQLITQISHQLSSKLETTLTSEMETLKSEPNAELNQAIHSTALNAIPRLPTIIEKVFWNTLNGDSWEVVNNTALEDWLCIFQDQEPATKRHLKAVYQYQIEEMLKDIHQLNAANAPTSET
ncbi:hypothetical protein [Endozoicomonas ascidiicola]|uniref:hypothetical protein n=1 Tax=Endozoicomonas ascidiicola TaxID=1698521 RepID=UPI0008304E5A|nr:hypothetical protein [Endozoicomonas ascidiicola]